MKTLLTVFKALSDRNRLRVIAALAVHEELCACQITELLQVAGATASRHLSILTSAGLTTSRKHGRWVYYRICEEHGPLEEFAPFLQWMMKEFDASEEAGKDRKALRTITETEREALCRKQRGVACCPVETV